MIDTATSICEICGKEKNSGRDGSLTQFVFRFDTCRCEFQSLAKFQKKLDHSQSVEKELQLSPDSFPSERYSPLKELGRGASGTVYLCMDRLLGKHVAVKVLNTVDAEKLLAFQHEAKATSRLNHPNIIMIRDFGATANGAPFMVIDYCEGPTLGQFYTYAQQAKSRAARDRKAQIEREKHAANHAWSDKKIESSDADRVESLNSISAKQCGPLAAKEAVEVFTAFLETLQMHAHAQPPALSQLCPDDDFKALSKIVQRCLEKDPQHRFQSAEELRQALEGAIKYDTNDWKELEPLTVRQHRKNWKQRASALAPYAITLAVVALLTCSLFMFVADPDFILSRLDTQETNSSTPATTASTTVQAPLAAANSEGSTHRGAPSKPKETQLIFDRTVDAIPELEGGPVYLQKQRGEDFDNYMVQGHVRYAEDLKVLQGKQYIKRLDLRFDDLKGDTCKALEELPLERINLIGSELNDETFVQLAQIKPLVQISVAGCKGVTDDGLKHLSSLPNLLFLRLGDTEITDKSIDTFLKLGELRELRMSGCMDITPAGLLRLQTLKNLETLTFRKCNVDYKLLDSLDKFKSLQYLGLSDLDNDSIKHLLDSKISTLSIGDGNKLTDRGLIELSKLKSLRNLYLVPNKLLTNYGIETFKRKNPRCVVELGVSDAPGRML